MGRSFRDISMSVRFTRACELLAERPCRLVKDVAYELGYSSPQAFARFIRRLSGVTPCELQGELLSRRKP
jgi:AraC-like DNA-binding protein